MKKARTVAALSFAAVAISTVMQAQGATEEAGPNLRLVFPVTIYPPTVTEKSEGIGSGGVLYSQEIRSRGAIRLTADHTVHYIPHGMDGLDAKGEAVFPAGTLFMLARNRLGPMYCSARPEGKDTWLTYHDVGVCLRDSDGDGKIDQEVVLNPNGWRQRIAYEVLGTGGSDWTASTITSEPVPPSEIPGIKFQVKYLVTPGGWLSRGKGYLAFGLYWPPSMVSEGAGDDTGKDGANIDGAQGSETRGFWPGEKGKISTGPVSLEYEVLADNTFKSSVTSGLPPGEASMFVVGKNYNVNNYKFQRVIVRFRPGDALLVSGGDGL